MNDKEILEIYNAGRHEDAFNEIVKSYSERLYWQVRPVVGSHEDADDVLQDVFVKVWTALPSFRGEAQLSTWLYRIALNTAITHATRERRYSGGERSMDASGCSEAGGHSKAGDGSDFNGGALGREAADAWFDGDRASRLISSAIAALPPKQRAVFSLRYFDEMPYEQISAIMGSSVGALKASYHFAFEKVKKKIGEDF